MTSLIDPMALFGIERRSVTLGLSVLPRLLPKNLLNPPGVVVAIPDNLVRLVAHARDGSKEHLAFLSDVVSEFAESEAGTSGVELAQQLHESFAQLREANALVEIGDDDLDGEVQDSLVEAFEEDRYQISLSPRRNFVREYYKKVVSWAKKTGSYIIEATAYPFRKMGHYISTLQLPDKFDALVEAKRKHIDRLLAFKGGQGLKWFIAAASGAAGIFTWYLGIPGLVIAFFDP